MGGIHFETGLLFLATVLVATSPKFSKRPIVVTLLSRAHHARRGTAGRYAHISQDIH